jgi:uncharacterized protein (TIGR02453 family)
MAEFTGVPQDALDFFDELAADNCKRFWMDNKQRYDQIKTSMQGLGDSINPRFHPLKVFRPNRDVRFSADKSPYKTNIGMSGETDGGSIVYVHLDAEGMFAAAGMYMMARDQVQRFRFALDHDVYGPEFVEILTKLESVGLKVGPGMEPPLKTRPRGFAADHPRIELLCWKGAIVSRGFGSPAWIHTAKLTKAVESVWLGAGPLIDWLDVHVRPSEEMKR